MSKRQMFFVAVLVGSSAILVLTGSPTPAPDKAVEPVGAARTVPQLNMTMIVGGGYVFDQTGGQMTLIASSSMYPGHHQHKMLLELLEGGYSAAETDVPLVQPGNDPAVVWDLSDSQVSILADNVLPPGPPVSVPPSTRPANPCAVPKQPGDIDNWFYVTSLSDILHMKVQRASNYDSQIITKIPLTTGSLHIKQGSSVCLAYKDATGAIRD